MYLLGYDIGSSSVKVALVAADDGSVIAAVQSPDTTLPISSPQPGWAEQDPDRWWLELVRATQKIGGLFPEAMKQVAGIGLSYQMHGLVLVDETLQVLRPAIIWCDSRAVATGQRAFREIGEEQCLRHLLNSPANFTASRLAWVRQHEPDIYRRAYKMLLPGDYIAMRMTGQATTTPAGLSEAILWDYQLNTLATFVLEYFHISQNLIPELVPNIAIQGTLTPAAAQALGLQPGIAVSYRAGDQPNNAMSLNVLNPGEAAATGGTSGVVYSLTDRLVYDPLSRINSFLHVNHSVEQPRIGALLCINGAGIQYSWLRQHLALDPPNFATMDRLASQVPTGADGLMIFPFGNGAERMLGNRNPGGHITGLQFSRHTHAHLCRAALEGVAFAFVYGMRLLKGLGLGTEVIRVGNDNLFRSEIFAQTIATLMGCNIEVVKTTGAIGAARAAGVAIGCYPDLATAMQNLETLHIHRPLPNSSDYLNTYQAWENELLKILQTDNHDNS